MQCQTVGGDHLYFPPGKNSAPVLVSCGVWEAHPGQFGEMWMGGLTLWTTTPQGYDPYVLGNRMAELTSGFKVVPSCPLPNLL